MNYDQYIGIPYKQANCADLAIMFQEKEFGKKYGEYVKPECKSPFALSLAVKRNLMDFMEDRLSLPKHGCAALLLCRGRLSHIGTYLRINEQDFILHTSESFQSSIMTAMRDLKKFGIQIEGFYQWK